MIPFNLRYLIVVAVTCCSASVCNADLFVLFSDDGGASFSDNYSVAAGDNVTVDVFLGQNGANSELTNPGLFSFGITANASTASFGSITDAAPNPDYDFVNTDQFTPTTLDWDVALLANATPTGNEIRLGSFDFSTSAIGSTTFSFADIQPGSGAANASWLTDDAAILDEIIFGSGAGETFNLTINAVPEPTLALLIGLIGIAACQRRVR